MQHVFISYVKENKPEVDRLYEKLKASGIELWIDRKNLRVGSDWENVVRTAIRNGSFFIACFSKEFNNRDRSFMNEELVVAIEEIRMRPSDLTWFIPIKLNKCEIPNTDIGRGKTLRNLHYLKLYEDREGTIQHIIKVIQDKFPEIGFVRTTDNRMIHRSVRPEFEKGFEYQQRGHKATTPEEKHRCYQKSIDCYDNVLKQQDDIFEAYFNRGNAYYNIGVYDKAIESYTKAIEIQPTLVDAFFNRGMVYHKLGKLYPAIADYNDAIDIQPDHVDAHYCRSNAFAANNEHEKAIAGYTRTIELKPNHANAYYNRGVSFGYIEELDSLMADYDRAIDLKPDYAQAYYSRGIVWLIMANLEKARRDLKVAKNMRYVASNSDFGGVGSVNKIEQLVGYRLPYDIAAMLKDIYSNK